MPTVKLPRVARHQYVLCYTAQFNLCILPLIVLQVGSIYRKCGQLQQGSALGSGGQPFVCHVCAPVSFHWALGKDWAADAAPLNCRLIWAVLYVVEVQAQEMCSTSQDLRIAIQEQSAQYV